MTSQVVLQLERVSQGVLKDVSLEVKQGELWALLGPNGAGKSTLLKAVLGNFPGASGHMRLFGKEISSLTPKERAQAMAWVPQHPAEETGFSALELVLTGLTPWRSEFHFPKPSDVDAALKLLEEVGIANLANRLLDEMSGGERRLCYLARARMQNAQLLLLDEPTAFLDLRNQVACLSALVHRVNLGLSVVAVLHDVNLAAQFATHVALLKSGSLMRQGTVSEVLNAEILSELYEVPFEASQGNRFTLSRTGI